MSRQDPYILVLSQSKSTQHTESAAVWLEMEKKKHSESDVTAQHFPPGKGYSTVALLLPRCSPQKVLC